MKAATLSECSGLFCVEFPVRAIISDSITVMLFSYTQTVPKAHSASEIKSQANTWARLGPSQSPRVESMESCRYMHTIRGCALITDVIKRRALCMCEIKTMLSDISLVCRLSNSLTLTDV